MSRKDGSLSVLSDARLPVVVFIVVALLAMMPVSSPTVEGARLINTFSDGSDTLVVSFTPGQAQTLSILVKADITVTQAVLNVSANLLEIDTPFVLGMGIETTGQGLDLSGDVNNDGHNDLLLSIPGNNGNTGRMDVLYGTATGITFNNPTTVSGTAQNQLMGFDVANGGDLNGDGYDEMVGGAIEMDFGTSAGTGRGTVHIVWGSNRLNTTADRTLSVGAVGDMFGFSLSTHGDVNGDGYDDIVVGAPRHIQNTNNPGRAYVFLGNSTGPNATTYTQLTGSMAGDGFGMDVHICGDVNDDGYDDVLVGAPLHNGTNATEYDWGKAYLFLGGASGVSTTPVWTYIGNSTEDYLGYSVSGAGDVNGDGYDDIAIAVPLEDPGSITDAGAVLIFHGGSGGPSATPDAIITGSSQNEVLGAEVANLYDMDKDGLGDIVIGAPGAPNGTTTAAGAVYVHFGSSGGLEITAGAVLHGDTANSRFGASVAMGGDVDGDGYNDFSFTDTFSGWGWVYFGGAGAVDPEIYMDDVEIFSQAGMFRSETRTDDFTTELNAYIASHQSEVDLNGFIRVRLNVTTGNTCELVFSNLNIIIFKLVQPTNLAATALPAGNSIKLTWTDHTQQADDISKMAIEMWNGTDWEEVAKVAKNARDYTVTDLEDGTLYTFRLRAFDGAVQQYSQPSDAASATPADTKAPGKVMTLLAKEDRDLMGINVSWDPSDSDVVDYQVWCNKTGAWAVLANVSAPLTHYTDTDVDDGPRYYYRVRAWDEVPLVGEFSNTVWGILADLEPPVVPSNLRITEPATGRALLIRWDLNDDDTREYSLECNKSGSWREIALLGKNVNAYTDGNLVDGTRYYYRIQARDESGNPSEYSSIVSAVPVDSTPPTAPDGLEVAPRPVGNMLRLTWVLNTDDTVGYNIYLWDASASQWTVMASVTGQVSTYDLSGLENGETYRVRLKAVDLAEWESDWSNEATGVPVDTSPPMIPGGLDAENDPNGRAVNITWSANNDDTVAYVILRWSGTSWVEVGRVDHPRTWFFIDGLENNQPYAYVVRAVDEADNESPNSARLDVIPVDTIKPDPPVFIDLPTITNERDLVIKGRAEYGATVKVFLNLYPQDPVDCEADGSFQITVRLKSGPNEVSAVAEDDAGDSDSSPRYTIIVDTTGPKVSSTQPPSGTRSMPRSNLTFDVYFSEEVKSTTIKCILRKGVQEVSTMLQDLGNPANIEARLTEYDRVRSIATFEVEEQLESGSTYSFLVYQVEDIAGNPLDHPGGAYLFTLETSMSGGGGGGGVTSEGLGSLAIYLAAAIVIILVIIVAVVLVSRSGTKEEIVLDREVLAAPREEPSAEDMRPDISDLYADAYQERGETDTEHHQVEAGLGSWLAEQEQASKQADEETRLLVEEMGKQAPPPKDDHVIEEIPPDVFKDGPSDIEGPEGDAEGADAEAPEEEVPDQEEAAALLDELDEELGEDDSEEEDKEG